MSFLVTHQQEDKILVSFGMSEIGKQSPPIIHHEGETYQRGMAEPGIDTGDSCCARWYTRLEKPQPDHSLKGETMNLTFDQIKQLGAAERKMDSGEAPYVRLGSDRLMMTTEAMAQFELQAGQTISNTMLGEILNFNLAQCRSQADVEAAKKEAGDH